MSHLLGKTLLATGFHAPEAGSVERLDQALIAIGADGVIETVTHPSDADYARLKAEARAADRLETLPEGAYLLPGFVDLHVHAPQIAQLGSALDVPLEVWLGKHTFPLEARYADLAFARRAYSLLVDDLIANGTTTALYFATLHQEATQLLVDICLELGQRAFVGKVAMDHPESCPDYYRDASVDAALTGTRDLIDYTRGHPDNRAGLVQPVITPRFIPACTDATLEGLGAIAADTGAAVQTHVSESDWEHGYVLARHQVSDTDSLDRFGLLGRRSVLAHGNFLSAGDLETLAVRRSAVAHCPVSNAYFANAVFPLRAALEKGVTVGLGSDVSGGPSASLFDGCRSAIMVSHMLESGVDPDLTPETRSTRRGARIDHRLAFHLATVGGAKALDLKVGLFAPGYHFDAMLVDTRAASAPIHRWPELDDEAVILEKIIQGATRANIAKVWIGGRLSSRSA